MKPRTRDDHLVSMKLMINAYCTIGMFETAAAYFVFYTVFGDYGFNSNMILGQGLDFILPYNKLSDGRKNYYTEMCPEVKEYSGSCSDGPAFSSYRYMVHRRAETAFLMTVVWC